MQSSESIENSVASQLESLGVDYEVFEIDPDFADTAQFCEKYGFPLENSGNTIVVASKRGRRSTAPALSQPRTGWTSTSGSRV